MKLQKQVCKLRQAQKLKDLGIEQKTLWQWKVNNTQTVVIETPMAMWIEKYVPPVGNVFFSAFTLSELGQMLGYENVPYFSTEYDMWMLPKGSKLKGAGLGSINECEIRAELLLYAIEQGLLSVETCNGRLAE
jgi:hypothetical protein